MHATAPSERRLYVPFVQAAKRTLRSARKEICSVQAFSPEEAFRKACEEQGVMISDPSRSNQEDEEDWEDIQEDMEDFWMREPKADALDLSDLGLDESAAANERVPQAIQEIRLEELAQLIASYSEGVVVLDVRSAEEFQERALQQASNIPLQEINRDTAAALQGKDLVAVASSGDSRSMQACVRLSRVYGLESVRHLVDW